MQASIKLPFASSHARHLGIRKHFPLTFKFPMYPLPPHARVDVVHGR